jgi:hypothetical protein
MILVLFLSAPHLAAVEIDWQYIYLSFIFEKEWFDLILVFGNGV